MNLKQYYHEQSKNLPDYITILTMRKFFVYEEIFKENPDIAIDKTFKIEYDNNSGYGIMFKNIYNLDINGNYIENINGASYKCSKSDCINGEITTNFKKEYFLIHI